MGFLGKSAVLALAMVLAVPLAAGVASASAQPSSRATARAAAIRSEPSDSARILASRHCTGLGFVVSNLSGHAIKLVKVTGSNHFCGRSHDGSTLGPKDSYLQGFNVRANLFDKERNTAHWAILGNDGQEIGTFAADLNVQHDLLGPFRFDIACRTSLGKCTVSPAGDVITLFGDSAPPGSKPTGPARTSAAPSDVTKNYLVYNLSDHPIRLIRTFGDDKFESRTPDGSILAPKSAWHFFNLVVYLFKYVTAVATYSILDKTGQFQIGSFAAIMRGEVLKQDAGCEAAPGRCSVSPAADVIFLHTVNHDPAHVSRGRP